MGLGDRTLQRRRNEMRIVIGRTYIMTPLIVLTTAAVLQNIDRTLELAASDRGASPLVTFAKITLPWSAPGVVAGTLIVFTLTVSAYVTPSMLSGGKKTVMSMLIFQQYATIFDFRFGAALSVDRKSTRLNSSH